ncbi:unnamed protein product [Camellia sinensis]
MRIIIYSRAGDPQLGGDPQHPHSTWEAVNQVYCLLSSFLSSRGVASEFVLEPRGVSSAGSVRMAHGSDRMAAASNVWLVWIEEVSGCHKR